MPDLKIDPKTTSMFVMDFYTETFEKYPHSKERNVIEKGAALLKAGRDAGLLISYSAGVFRPGYPEKNHLYDTWYSKTGPMASAIPFGHNHPYNTSVRPVSDPYQTIHPAVKPLDGDIVVGKHRSTALFGTDLEMVWRAKQIKKLISPAKFDISSNRN